MPLWSRLWRAALPQDCLLCGQWSGQGSDDGQLCRPCLEELPALRGGCPVCAMPGPASTRPGGAVCGACLAHPPQFDATIAAWSYGYPADRLVQALKFRGRLAVAPLLARALAERVSLADLVVAMPLHPARVRDRGFNQAVEIARHLAKIKGVPLALDCVRRIRHTLPQTGLPPSLRSRNVRGAFACEPRLAGLRIAVVDDVMTTGATLDELARVLKRAGAAHVQNWIVARTLD